MCINCQITFRLDDLGLWVHRLYLQITKTLNQPCVCAWLIKDPHGLHLPEDIFSPNKEIINLNRVRPGSIKVIKSYRNQPLGEFCKLTFIRWIPCLLLFATISMQMLNYPNAYISN